MEAEAVDCAIPVPLSPEPPAPASPSSSPGRVRGSKVRSSRIRFQKENIPAACDPVELMGTVGSGEPSVRGASGSTTSDSVLLKPPWNILGFS